MTGMLKMTTVSVSPPKLDLQVAMVKNSVCTAGQRAGQCGGGGEKRTGVELGGHSVEHVGVHVGVDSPVGVGVVAGGDEDGVALGDSDSDEVGRVRLDIGLQANI